MDWLDWLGFSKAFAVAAKELIRVETRNAADLMAIGGDELPNLEQEILSVTKWTSHFK